MIKAKWKISQIIITVYLCTYTGTLGLFGKQIHTKNNHGQNKQLLYVTNLFD